MNIHEYQAKAVLREFGVPVPRGEPAFSVDEAVAGAQKLGGPVWVVKAQIHAGGRGKAGGVKVVKSIDDVKKESARILGSTLVTHQTGPHGKKVNRLYIEEGSAIERELYLSMLVDRESSRVAIVASTEGGMEIEKVAHDTPEKIATITVDPVSNICPHHVRRLSKALNLDADLQKQMGPLLSNLYKAFVETDMALLEINPLVLTKEERLAVQGTTADEIVREEHRRQGASNVTVRNVITSMRLVSAVDWAEFFEDVSLVDAALRAESDFAAMDFPTRDRYRHSL